MNTMRLIILDLGVILSSLAAKAAIASILKSSTVDPVALLKTLLESLLLTHLIVLASISRGRHHAVLLKTM